MMKFNITMGTAIVPLLARLVLCAAFLTMGWNKIINDHTFRGDDAQILIELGVVDQPAASGAVGQPASYTQFSSVLRGDEANDDDEYENETDQPADDRQDRENNIAEEVGEIVDEVLAPARRGTVTRDPETGEFLVTAKRVHTVTVIVYKHDGPSPVVMGWLATLTELVGGALLLIGLFTRIWGIMLASMMAVAFYLTSWPALADLGLFGIAADMAGGYANYNRMYVQLALFVLAFGVFLTGAGPLSLDRWLFRPSAPPKVPDEDV